MVLLEIGVIIELPIGSLIGLPSGLLTHLNADTNGKVLSEAGHGEAR